MIYDPITRQEVSIVGKFPPQGHCWQFGRMVRGEFLLVRVRYGKHLPGFSGGFPEGTERDIDRNCLTADSGVREIAEAHDAAPQLEAAPLSWPGAAPTAAEPKKRTVTVAGKRYTISTRTYDNHLTLKGHGVDTCLPEGFDLDGPGLRERVAAVVAGWRQQHREASAAVQQYVRENLYRKPE